MVTREQVERAVVAIRLGHSGFASPNCDCWRCRNCDAVNTLVGLAEAVLAQRPASNEEAHGEAERYATPGDRLAFAAGHINGAASRLLLPPPADSEVKP